MIDIKRKEDCVGCNACVQRCPKVCISMIDDEQGFLYPKVDLDKCIDCHLCEKVCPVINKSEPRKPLHAYAAKNKDPEVQRTSSSGGMFFALAEYVIKEKQGVVFGARFNDKWEVVHDYAENIEDVKAFKGSKYVQSRIGDSFKIAENFLKAGRIVLFSGTPCQVAGLRLFLRKDYGEKLILVDFVCHGVPSPLVWRDYLQSISLPKGVSDGKNTVLSSLNVTPTIVGISFRDKRFGWEKFGFAVRCATTEGVAKIRFCSPLCHDRGSGKNSVLQPTINQDEEQELLFETLDKNLYMQGFLKDLYLRPSCYACPAKCGKSGSDITLADFWGIKSIDNRLYSNLGVSLMLCYTDQDSINSNESMQLVEVSYAQAMSRNTAICKSAKRPKENSIFWGNYAQYGIPLISRLVSQMKSGVVPSLVVRVYRYLKRRIDVIFQS